ncbi:MAG: TFIIB-type zinc finger domain-containing protein [Candidatus Aenigmarchaeota archaeon]|nr:TFIIB-type zinc finger domain-containing protein [Candidatus Aenigmarchaeota archaeon]
MKCNACGSKKLGIDNGLKYCKECGTLFEL